MDKLPDGEYTERSFEDHFKPDTRSDYSDLIQKEKLPCKRNARQKIWGARFRGHLCLSHPRKIRIMYRKWVLYQMTVDSSVVRGDTRPHH